jgi:LysR family transcriptional regulator (chromosome initiation inhibitor)
MLETSQLQTLAAVVEAGTFSRAQRHLRLTQPALSKRIKALEAAIGQPVLLRTTPVRATEVGQRLIAHFRHLEMVEAELLTQLGTPSAPEGVLRLPIALNTESLSTWFIPAIRPWLERRNLLLQLYVDDQAQTDRMLRSGKVLGCVTSQPAAPTNCISHFLGSMTYRCVCTPQFRRRHFKSRITATALLEAPAAVYGVADDIHQEYLSNCFPSYGQGIPNLHYVPSPEGIFEFAREGFAYALVPELAVRSHLYSRALINLLPRTYKLDLYWHAYDTQAGLLVELTEALLLCTKTIFV